MHPTDDAIQFKASLEDWAGCIRYGSIASSSCCAVPDYLRLKPSDQVSHRACRIQWKMVSWSSLAAGRPSSLATDNQICMFSDVSMRS